MKGDEDDMVSQGKTIALAVPLWLALLTSNQVAADYPGYPEDSQSKVYTNSFGECWRAPGSPVDAPKPGCEPDGDGDGVADVMDECPHTAKGVAVDAKGCPSDSDGDGVADEKDRCPDTPKAMEVDANGCPPDSDGDGVPDYLDECPGTAADVKVDAKGCEVVGDVVLTAVGGVNFKRDSAQLTDAAKTWLDDKVAAYKRAADRNRIRDIRVIGYTDSSGDAAYNEALSTRRASAVGRYLAEKGIPAELIFVEGRGERDPIASNATPEGRAQNRRVVIDVSTVGEP
jgi:OOP family OmpA-OmpF porin